VVYRTDHAVEVAYLDFEEQFEAFNGILEFLACAQFALLVLLVEAHFIVNAF